MLKNATVYTFAELDPAVLDDLSKQTFTPCLSHQALSQGWQPVLDDTLVHQVRDFLFLSFVTEKKSIPGSGFKLLLAERVRERERVQGFAPGKKVVKEMKEALIDELLPSIIPARRVTSVIIDLTQQRVMIDTTSDATADAIASSLFRNCTFEIMQARPLGWLLTKMVKDADELEYFTLEDEAKIRLTGDNKAAISYKEANLHTLTELHQYLADGAGVTDLALTFDNMISFKLSHDFRLSGIKATDVLKDEMKAAEDPGFDGTCLLAGSRMRQLVDGILDAQKELA